MHLTPSDHYQPDTNLLTWLDSAKTTAQLAETPAVSYSSFSWGGKGRRHVGSGLEVSGFFPSNSTPHSLSPSVSIFLNQPPACPACQHWGRIPAWRASVTVVAHGPRFCGTGGRWGATLRLVLPVLAGPEQGTLSAPGFLRHGDLRWWLDHHSETKERPRLLLPGLETVQAGLRQHPRGLLARERAHPPAL